MIIYSSFNNFPQKSRKQKFTNAILYILFGLIFMFLSNFIVKSFAIMIGVLLILFAIYHLIFGIVYKQGFSLITSILMLVLGIVAIAANEGLITFIKIFLAIGAISLGIKRVFYSFMLKDYSKYWFVNTIVGVIISVLGIMMLAGKFELNIIVIILGAIFTIYGVSKLISLLNKKEQEYSDKEMNQFFEKFNKNHTNEDDIIDVEVKEKNDHEDR